MKIKFLSLLILAAFFIGCKGGIDDSRKRNENWVWWIDSKTNTGKWIPVEGDKTVTDGKYTRFYFNGKIFKKGELVNGKQSDTAFYFKIDGQPLSYSLPVGDSIFHYFIKDGYNIQRNQKGSIIGKGLIKNRIFGDQWTTYYDNGKVNVIKNLQNNYGWVTSYYENGNVRDSSYQNGQTGLFNVKSWYENGKVRKEYEYDHEYIAATVKEFYNNGVLSSTGTIINGVAEGKADKFYKSGKLEAIVNRKKGLFDGFQKSFHENGKTKIEGYMKKNVADGEMKVYDENGRLTKHDLYKDGLLIKSLLAH